MNKISKPRLLGIMILILLLIQFIPTDRTIQANDSTDDFFSVYQVPEDVSQSIKNACLDCHSDNTRYPWYAKFQPVSWWIQGHVDHARKKLNFSAWNSYSDKRKDHKLEECIEEIEKATMPLKSYAFMHKSAQLSQEQKDAVVAFLKTIR